MKVPDTYNGEFFKKETIIKELIDFEQQVMSLNASIDYVEGIQAVINRLERRPSDLYLGFDCARGGEAGDETCM